MTRTLLGFSLLTTALANMASADSAPPVQHSVPINPAEAILEPFWDPQLSGLADWEIADGSAHGLKVTQGWAWVDIAWMRRPETGAVVRLTRTLEVDCSRYDKLMVCVNPGKGNGLRLVAQTDAGERRAEFTGYRDERKEYFLDLDGATRLQKVTLEITPAKDEPGAAWIQWLGLQSSSRLADVQAQYGGFDVVWPKHLKADGYKPRLKPAYGIALNNADLEALWAANRQLRERPEKTVFEAAAEHARKQAPETMIRDFVSYINSRTSRDRDSQRWLLQTGVNAALAGLVLEDPALLRLGARYALSIAACPYWDDGFTAYYPLSAWEQRPFIQALAAHDVAMILDLAGEMFTETGRDLLRRRLAEHALGSMNFNYWKFDYIYKCNQAAWFSPGRLLAYGVLEQEWPRVRPYTDLACKDLLASLDEILLPDGSYTEGPMYFNPVGRDAALALYYYSRYRERDYLQTLPARMQNAADFGELILTTRRDGDYIPYGDSYNREFPPFVKATMAYAMPDSAWGEMLRRTLARQNADSDLWPLTTPFHPNYLTSLSDVVIAWKMARDGRSGTFKARPFVHLPDSGMMASTRMLGKQPVKLLVIGNRANATHNHEDKGSFILEMAGECFLTDPILAASYGDPAIALGKQAQAHNLLVPTGTTDRPAQLNPLPVDIKPTGTGDAASFQAEINLTAGWPGFYKKWIRSWNSPRPDTLVVRDEYELAQGSGVEFTLFTELPTTVDGPTVRITGQQARLNIATPADCTVQVQDVAGYKTTYRKITLARPKPAGTLEVGFTLQVE